jgi:DnaD/phage-associated family protein
MSGWIKLHRQIVNSSKFADPDILRLWILCLTKAAHKDTIAIIDRQEVPILVGQFVTGRFALHQEYNAALSPRKRIKDTTLWSWLKRLEEWGDLDINSTNKYSVVTLVKWSDYQETLTAEPQQIDNSLTAKPQQTDTYKNVKNLENLKESTTTAAIVPIVNPFKLFESEGFGTLSSIIGEKIGDFIDTYSERWVCEAMKEAAYYGKRNLPYVKSILDRYKTSGIDEPWNKPKEGVNSGGAQTSWNDRSGGSNQTIKAVGNASTWTGTQQGESKVHRGKWDDVVISLPAVQG